MANNGAAATNDVSYWYGLAGWQWPIFSFGQTFAGFDYTEETDVAANGDFSQAFGLAVVQKVDSIATEFYRRLAPVPL